MDKFELLKQNAIFDYKMQADNLYMASMHPKQENFEVLDAEYNRLVAEMRFVFSIIEKLDI